MNKHSDVDKRVRDDIRRYGWHIILVGSNSRSPGWGYSIGLFETFKHPEVVVFGLDKEVTKWVINAIGDSIKAGGSFEAGSKYPDLLDGVICHFQAVEKCWYEAFLGRAISFYESEKSFL